MRPGDTALDRDNIVLVKEMVAVCSGVVAGDNESGFVGFVHYTTLVYFLTQRADWIVGPDEWMASTCLTYLSFPTLADTTYSTNADMKMLVIEHRLADYAAYA
jgi:hypothetical protein